MANSLIGRWTVFSSICTSFCRVLFASVHPNLWARRITLWDQLMFGVVCKCTQLIYCITCTLCKKIYIGETGRRLADHFREHLRDAEQNNTDASKPVACHFNLPNHSHHNIYLRAILTPREHRKPEKSRTKINFSTGYTLSTRNQWTLLIPLIYSQIHVTISSPMAKLLYTLI